jgi:transposase
MTTMASESLAERYARFIEMRDNGMRPVDVARELGVSMGVVGRLERSYRQLRQRPANPRWSSAMNR